MDINIIANQTKAFAIKAYELSKAGVIWSGHFIKISYSDYAIPAAKKLSEVAVIAFNLLQRLIRTGPGMIFALSGTLLLVGVTAFKLADRKAYEEDLLAKTAWKTVGIAAFISATALSSLGIYAAVI